MELIPQSGDLDLKSREGGAGKGAQEIKVKSISQVTGLDLQDPHTGRRELNLSSDLHVGSPLPLHHTYYKINVKKKKKE